MIPAKTILFMSIISPKTILIVSLAYFALLFLVAYYAEKCRKKGNCLLKNSHIYSLSLAVYCTSWTFYGSVGKAATSGLEFLPIYLAPLLLLLPGGFFYAKSSSSANSKILPVLLTFSPAAMTVPQFLAQLSLCLRSLGLPLYSLTAESNCPDFTNPVDAFSNHRHRAVRLQRQASGKYRYSILRCFTACHLRYVVWRKKP